MGDDDLSRFYISCLQGSIREQIEDLALDISETEHALLGTQRAYHYLNANLN